MPWNWQQPGWPTLTYDPAALEPLERQFLLGSGEVLGGPATRDLQDLVVVGALTRTGELRHTRYYLNMPNRE